MPTTTLNQPKAKEELHAAIDQARQACNIDAKSSDCATAWDIVEEMQAEMAHRRQFRDENSLETYCSENPDALECRVYDV
ncbi:MAG: Calvin cycle protein CP12 [Elainellaceae cyanobacterium]